jgi:glutathione S-transferase
MYWVAVVSILALIEYMVITGLAGSARGKYGVVAPATAGNDMFERYYRVQMNSVEQLVVFLPALWICAWLGATTVAAVAGICFVIGRAIYAVAYVKSPEKRSAGFVIGFLANVVLVLRGLVAAVMAI